MKVMETRYQLETSGREADKTRLAVPVEMLPDMEAQLQKMAKKAKRLHLPVPEISVLSREAWVCETRETEVVRDDYAHKRKEQRWIPVAEADFELDHDSKIRMVATVEFSNQVVRLQGWRVAGVVYRQGSKSHLNAMPGYAPKMEVFAGHELECEHCHMNRERVRTYVIENEKNELIQVGSSCLADFIPTAAPRSIQQWINYWEQCRGFLYDVPHTWWHSQNDSFLPRLFPIESVVAVAAAFCRQEGWVSQKQAGMRVDLKSTTDLVKQYILVDDPGAREMMLPGGVRPEDKDAAQATLALARKRLLTSSLHTGEWNPLHLNDYELNLQRLVDKDWLHSSDFGLAASLVPYANREKEKENKTVVTSNSEWFGEVKERGVYQVKLKRIKAVEIEGDRAWGMSNVLYIHEFNTDAGEAVWMTGRPLDAELVGQEFEVKATIKDHREFRGVKQTVFTRVSPLLAIEEKVPEVGLAIGD